MQTKRSVALKLHALHEDDQRWLLNHLSEVERQEMSELLAELKALGIPRISLPITDVIHDERKGEAAVERSAAFGINDQRLNEVTAPQLLVLSESEPPEVIGCLMSIGAWDWKEAFLQQLSEPYKEAVLIAQADSKNRISGNLAALMFDHLLEHISRMPPADLAGAESDGNQSLIESSRWGGVLRLIRSRIWPR